MLFFSCLLPPVFRSIFARVPILRTVTYETTLKCCADTVIMPPWQATLVMITVMSTAWFYAVFITSTRALLCFTQIEVLSGEQHTTICLRLFKFSPFLFVSPAISVIISHRFPHILVSHSPDSPYILSSYCISLFVLSVSVPLSACSLWRHPLADCLHWFALEGDDVILWPWLRLCVCALSRHLYTVFWSFLWSFSRSVSE